MDTPIRLTWKIEEDQKAFLGGIPNKKLLSIHDEVVPAMDFITLAMKMVLGCGFLENENRYHVDMEIMCCWSHFGFDKAVTKNLSHYLIELCMCQISSVCWAIYIVSVEHQYVPSRWYVLSHSTNKKDMYFEWFRCQAK